MKFNFVSGSMNDVQGDSMIRAFQNHANQSGNIKKIMSSIDVSWLWVNNVQKDEADIRDLTRDLIQMCKGQTVFEDIFKYIDDVADKEQMIRIFMNELLLSVSDPEQKIQEVSIIDPEIKAISLYQKYFQRESVELERKEKEKEQQEQLQQRINENGAKVSIDNRDGLIQELEKGVTKEEEEIINEQSMVVNDQQQNDFIDEEFDDEEGQA